MNATVAKMLGEADFHSPEEKAQLAAHDPNAGGAPGENLMAELDAVEQLIRDRNLGQALEKIRALKPEMAKLFGGERPRGLSMLANGGGGYSDTRALTTMSMMALPQSQSYASSP